MSILKAYLEKRGLDHQSLKPYENGRLAPRPGFYAIKSIIYQTLTQFTDVPIATACWSRNPNEFLPDSEVQIQVFALYQSASVGPKEIHASDLIGKMIHVKETWINRNNSGSTARHAYHVSWEIVDRPSNFVNSRYLFEKAFFSGSESVVQSMETFYKSLPFETASILIGCEWEISDEWQEDQEDGLDAYDAEID